MKNIEFKMVLRVFRKLLLPLFGLMWFSNVYSAMTVRIGDRVENSAGNSITIETNVSNEKVSICIDGLSLEYSGPNYWSVDDSQAQFNSNEWSWIDNGCYAVTNHKVGTFSFFADYDNKVILVKSGGADGYISADNKVACRRKGVSLHADNVVSGDLIRWAKVDVANEDTLFLTQFDNNATLVDALDTTASTVRFYNRILRNVRDVVYVYDEDSVIIDSTVTISEKFIAENYIDITVSLENCGYSIVADDASACLSEPIVMTCGFLGAKSYRWLNTTTGDEQTISGNKLSVRPKGDETYQVYADGMLVGSINLTPKSMTECGYSLTALKDVLCIGKTTTLSSNYDKASKYEWYADGVLIETTTTPELEVKPTVTTTYSLYADGFWVADLTILVEECTFFIASRYPMVSCLQDSNVLMASGTAVLDDLDKKVFKWSKVKVDASGNEIGNWSLIASENSYRLPVAIDTSSNWKYRVEYDGLDTSIVYLAPDCGKNVFCDGLEAKTLFYETFGYFMAENVYVNNYNIYRGSVEVGHKSVLTVGDQTYYPSAQFDIANVYYQQEENHNPLPFSVDNTSKSTFNIRNFIAPDPNGYVVTPKKNQFSKTEVANCYVASDGHLFLAENPRLALYDWWGSTRDGGLRLQDGYYAIVMNPDSCDQQNESDDFISTSDATGNTNGAMLFVNAGSQPGAAIYAQHVSICPDRRFTFGMDVRNAMAGQGNPVNLTILLLKEFGDEDQVLGSVQSTNELARVQTGDVASGLTYWHRIDEYIQLDTKIGDFWVVIYNNGQSGSGNDILIDDITFSVCIPKVDMVVYNSAGDTLGNDVVSCESEELSLVAHRRTPEAQSYFMFQMKEKGVWVDMAQYDENDPLTALGGAPIDGEIRDTIKISTSDPRYSGTIEYRVVTGDNFEDVWAVAKGKTNGATQEQGCAFSNNVSESIITIKNTFGGEIDEILNFEGCDSVNSVITAKAVRGTVADDIEWLSSWVDANGVAMFAPSLDPVTNRMQPVLTGLEDALDIKILNTKDSLVQITYKGQTIERRYKDVEHMQFIYYYEGGDSTSIEDDCSHTVDVNVKFKTLLEISTNVVDTARGCNQVEVIVTRNLTFAPFSFNWYDSKGNEIVEGDLYHFDYKLDPNGLDSIVTLVVNKDSLSKISMFEGYILASPLSAVSGDYCINETSELKIPFQVHNGHYLLEIIPSVDPVCISEESEPTEIALSLKVSLKDFKGSKTDSLAILNKLNQFNWSVRFIDKEGKLTSEIEKETDEPIWNLNNATLRDYTSQTMEVSISSTVSDICETITQAEDVSSLQLSIREGGIKLSLATPGKVCLLDKDEVTLTATVTPKKSLLNILDLGLDWYLGNTQIAKTPVNSDSTEYRLTLSKKDYPQLFTAGNVATFKVGTYDDKCESNVVSPDAALALNGTGVTLKVPTNNCLNAGDNYVVEAVLDSTKASTLFKSYTWIVNGEVLSTSGLTFSYPVASASPNTEFKFIADDEICTSKYDASITKDINVKYNVDLSSAVNVICSTGSAVAKISVTPASSRSLINKYTWFAVKNGETIVVKEDVKSAGGELSDSLVITSEAYPNLFSAGSSFDLYVVAEDGICDAVESDSRLKFDVNVPITVALESSEDNSNSYCIGQDNRQEIKLTAKVTPESAANHIKAYIWKRLSEPILSDTTLTNVLILRDDWLSPGVNSNFTVSVYDGICSFDNSMINASKDISINRLDSARLQLDLSYYIPNKDTVCSVKDLVIIDAEVTTSDDLTNTIVYQHSYFYSKNPSRMERSYVPLDNPTVTTSLVDLSNFLPGDSLYFRVTIDDNICNTISKEIGTVVLTPFTSKVKVSEDTVCEGENVKFELVDFEPKQSENYIKYYSWYISSDGGSNYVPVVGNDNKPYDTKDLKSGHYQVLSYLSDGICYGVQMYGDAPGHIYSNVAEFTKLKVNAPIIFDLISSSDVFCEGETPDAITLAASVTQGEPKGYIWADSKGTIVRHEVTSSMSDYYSFYPTVSDNTYYVSVYDNICNEGATAAGDAFSVSVYQPFVLDIASSSYEICLGDSVSLGLGIVQGTAHQLAWSGGLLNVNKDNSQFSVAYPQLPGEIYYSVTASNGVCADATISVGPIIVHEPITVELTSDQSNVTIGADVNLIANVLTGNPTIFEWFDGDSSIAIKSEPTTSYKPRSSSTYTLYASDGVCPVSIAHLDLGVVLPTAFTPHYKDGLNDVYMEGYQVVIFDRYGQKVFEGGNGWDGTHRGAMADPGVYYSKVILNNGKVVSGTIEIVKHDK